MQPRFLLVLVTAFVLASVWAPTALAQQRPTLPSQQHTTLQAQSALATNTLPPVNVARLKAEDRDKRGQITPYRYGTVVDTDYRPEQDGTWERLPSGDWLWRLRIQSEEAVSLSLGFSRFELPDGASLFVYDPEGTLIRGPYTHSDATNGEHWTPLVHGEEIIVELEVPANKRDAVTLVIGSVVHGYRPLFPQRTSASKDGSCNLDVACDEADPWRDQVRSVGRYSFVRPNGRAELCSGSLINNTEKNGRSLFLTAEHCITGPSVANSMTFYWNYQNPTCRTQGTTENAAEPNDDLTDQTSSGAILLARYGNVHRTGSISGRPDLALVEVDDNIPKEYDLYLNGWSREDITPPRSTTIHHPQGDAKRISFDEDPASITGFLDNNGGNTHLRIGNWETGTTEGGSSGGPLYDPNQHVIGVLSGGFAECNGGVDDDNDPDWYGRLAVGFTKGDYQDRTFADVLDPNDTGDKSIAGQPLVPPPPASNFRVETVTDSSATLKWKAPEADNSAPEPSEYDLRVQSSFPIETVSEFENARRIEEDVPSPGPAGTTQEVTVALNPDTSYYFAIRTLDASKSPSPFVASGDASPVTGLRITRKPGPNPTSGQLTFGFSVETKQSVRADLFDIMGRRVRTLFQQDIQTRFLERRRTTDLSSLSSGVYFLRIRGASATHTEKIVVTK